LLQKDKLSHQNHAIMPSPVVLFMDLHKKDTIPYIYPQNTK